MSIWDSLLHLFGQRPKPSATLSTVKSDPAINVVLASDDRLPTPAPAPANLFKLLFNTKDKHKTVMLNSISLSTDMKTLYLNKKPQALV